MHRILLFVCLSFIGSIGQAEVVLNTAFGGPGSPYTIIGNNAVFGSKAVLFEATGSFNEFATLTLALFGNVLYGPGAGNVAIDLYSSTGSPPDSAVPDSRLTTLATIPIQDFNTKLQGSSWTGTHLGSGERTPGWYWIVIDTNAVSANDGALNISVSSSGNSSNPGAYYDPEVLGWIQPGYFPGGYAEIASVPEPSTLCLTLGGLACGGFSMWRRRMNRRRTKSGRCRAATRTVAILAMCMVCFSMRSGDAAPSLADITWGSATTISGDSDVDTTGTLVYAYNFGSSSSATAQTINGVTFQPFVIQDFTITQTTGGVTVSENNGYLISDVNAGSASAPFSGLSPSYRSLLSSEVYSSNFATMQVDLGGLTPGESYRLQWWTNDSSAITYGTGDYYFENVIGDGDTSSVTLDSNTSNAVGGLGQYVIGTFTAGGTTASFTLTGSGTGFVKFPMMNALQVRNVAVPEPSTYCMALAGLACGGYSMWRQRKRA